MSEEQVEAVREHIEAYRRDEVSVSLSFLDQHVVLDPSRVGSIAPGTAYGHEAVAQALRRYMGAFEDYAYEVERLTDLGSGAVLAVVAETGRGKESGVPAERSFAMLYTLIDGKIARITAFPSEEEALVAAGLREQAMSEENVQYADDTLQRREDRMVLATAKIEDFDRFWNAFSTKGAEKRKQHGSKGSHVFRDPSDDRRVWIVFDWDEEGFRNLLSDPDMPAIFEEGGLQDRPQGAASAGELDA